MGEHLLKRRLELNLFQTDVAKLLKVDEMTIVNWEKGHSKPRLRLLPRVYEFLGYVPESDSPRSFGEKLIQYRRLRGLSQKKMASMLKIDTSTLARWEQGRGMPSANTLSRLREFFKEFSVQTSPNISTIHS